MCNIFPHFQSLFFLLSLITSFSEAVDILSDKKMLAPAYFIVGGTKSGEVHVHFYHVHVLS